MSSAFALSEMLDRNRIDIALLTEHKLLLKMLGLYLHTLIIIHKSCKMLSILNKLNLQKNLQTTVTNNVFMKKVKTQQQQQNKKSYLKTLAGAGN